MKRFHLRNRQKSIPAFLLCIVFVVIAIFPIYWMIISSVMTSADIMSKTPPLVPLWDKLSGNSYVDIFTRYNIWQWLWNTIVIVFFATILSLVMSVMAGYSLSRYRSRGQFAIGIFLLLNKMLPTTLLLIPLYIMFSKMHLTNSYFAVILADVINIIPFTTWMMKGFFDEIPTELEEAAKIDGCSNFRAFVSVMLPLTAPGLAANGIYAFIQAWSDYINGRTLLTASSKWTITMGASSFIGEHSISWSNLMAMGIVAIIVPFFMFVLMEPFLVSGMTAGAVKG